MKIQINAAARLVTAAKANERKAIAYLKSLGIDVVRVKGHKVGAIALTVSNARDALSKIEKQFGKPDKRERFSQDERYTFTVGNSRRILVDVPTGLHAAPAGTVHLLDYDAATMLGK